MAVAEMAFGCTDEPQRERAERPSECATCGVPSWWNGWRLVFTVDGRRCEHWRARSKCRACRVSVTVYAPGHYPRRQYQLDAVADVAAAVAVGEEPAAKAATRAPASATSARRWTDWIADLIDPSVLLAVARTLDPDAPAGAGLGALVPISARRSRAARVLFALEELGAALLRRGALLACRTGLGRVLEWQRHEHGLVVQLTGEPRCLSPPMAPPVVHAGG